jgi:hypothetical protein
MKILQQLKLNYVKGLPFAIFTTTSISTYMSIKHEMNRPFMLPYPYHIKNVLFSSGFGAFAGICYPITFPLYVGMFMYNSSYKK